MSVFGLQRMDSRGRLALTVQAAFAAFFFFVTGSVTVTFCVINCVLCKSCSYLAS